jgi:hypothetical protein
MLDRAAAETPSRRPIEWQQADAMTLPFEDARFDSVVCQFGAMFFPDKPTAFGEAHRVLRPGGTFIFNVWDRIEENELSAIVMDVMAKVFSRQPGQFFLRARPTDTMTGAQLSATWPRAGSPPPRSSRRWRSEAVPECARHAAIAFCQGSPLRNEIDERDPAALGPATDAVKRPSRSASVRGPVDAKMQAHVIHHSKVIIMKIAIASDHAGFHLKKRIAAFLRERGHDVEDFGTDSDTSVDYPDFIVPAARRGSERTVRARHRAGRLRETGKRSPPTRVKGIRCTLCWNEDSARLARSPLMMQTCFRWARAWCPKKQRSTSSRSGSTRRSKAAAIFRA